MLKLLRLSSERLIPQASSVMSVHDMIWKPKTKVFYGAIGRRSTVGAGC